MKTPPELAAFLPKGSVLRAAFRTKMTLEGETLFLYDSGEQYFPTAYLGVLHDGRTVRLFDGVVSAVAGIQKIPDPTKRELVGFAYHEGGDEADTTFEIFAALNGTYRRVFKEETDTGRIRIIDSSPVTVEIWSAEEQLDPADSCVWCKHRYRVRTYMWERNHFRLTSQRITRTFFAAAQLAARPSSWPAMRAATHLNS
jgi:hypothetical protein